jgi:GT2 family glycosyltransferase
MVAFKSDSPEVAWRNGVSAADKGEHREALLWLARAVRLAPNDPRIALDLANIRLAVGGAEEACRAAVEFARLVTRYDAFDGWLGLLAARRLTGDHEGAAEALGELLSRHCVPADPAFAEVASVVARAAGRAGWCGLSGSGEVRISAAAEVDCRLDGVSLRLRDQQMVDGGALLEVRVEGAGLVGNPVDLAALRRVEGVVETAGDALTGWVSRPAAAALPRLILTDANGVEQEIALGALLAADADAPLTSRYGFTCSKAMLEGLEAPFRVTGPDQKNIFGSPVDPAAETLTPPVAADFVGPVNKVMPKHAGLAVVVPVYRGLALTQACLAALLAALPKGAEVILVDDATPEPELAAWLDTLTSDARIKLLRHPVNLGFPAAANAGIRAAAGRDILLLNSDTLVPPGAIEALAAAVYARPEIGSATPFSNQATILNYPRRGADNPAPDLTGTIALQGLAAKANRAHIVEIPTGVGFCMFMRHDCIAKTGVFRKDLFVQGYGEENDWCLRARHVGYRHVAAAGAFVAHHGGASFRAAGRALMARNARLLNRLYPGYDVLIAAHIEADPLAAARLRLDAARFRAGQRDAGAVLLISHNHGGGVGRRLEVEMRQIRDAGLRPILLCPATPDDPLTTFFPWPSQLTDGKPEDYPNLKFNLPADEPALLELLGAERINHVVLHHGLGHHPAVRGIAEKLGCKQDIVIHDYASFCPRVNLLGVEKRYCGEPNLAACAACVAQAGDETFEGLGPEKLVARSTAEFASARHIIAPSADTGRRIARHFPGVRPTVTPWEDDTLPVTLNPPGNGARRVAIIGGIGASKGYDVLLECARDANERRLPLEFLIAGSSSADEALLETGRIFITGPYQENEATELIAGLNADLAFLPSIWPETWCFALSEAWRAGLYTIAFDLGAQAERIAASKRGTVIPLGMPAPRINNILLGWSPR